MSVKQVVPASLKSKLKRIVLLKSEMSLRDRELKELQKQADEELDKLAASNHFQNGKLIIPGVALVSVALNPPKMIWVKEDASLTPNDREGVAQIVPVKYVKRDVKAAELLKALERGQEPEVLGLLTSKGIAVVQDSRYDIKAA